MNDSFFEGGPIPVVGITPSFITGLATQTAQSGVEQLVGQVWQGSGQSFLGQAGQSLAGNLAGSTVNVALNGLLGTQVASTSGLNLTSGGNFLASTLTPSITGALSAGINQNINQALQSAGPFGPVLATVGTTIVNQIFGGLTDSVLGGGTTGPNYKLFPGAGDEPEADYGGNAYTLGPNGSDVVFSIRPANVGPQAFGLSEAINLPKSATTLPYTEFYSMPLSAGSPVVNQLKKNTMLSGFTSVDPTNPFSFGVA